MPAARACSSSRCSATAATPGWPQRVEASTSSGSDAPEYPKSRLGKGWYENSPSKIDPGDDVLEKMAAHMLSDLCTPANTRNVTQATCKEILRDCAFDSMDSKAGAPLDGRPTHGGVGATVPRVGTEGLPPGAVVGSAG